MAEFTFEYDPGTIVFGQNCVADLEADLDALGIDRAMVVTGRTIGSTPAVMEPVRRGIAETLVATFDQTTPRKRLETAIAGVERYQQSGSEAIIALGGGSSLDIAKVICLLAARTTIDEERIRSTFRQQKTVATPAGSLPPVIAIPTTFAGADLSVMAGITDQQDEQIFGGVADARLMPSRLYYDPDLFGTTPDDVLCASAMNGFNKGIETIYAQHKTPITDSTAIRGLQLLRKGLPALGAGDKGESTLRDVIVGTILVQYGVSRPSETTLSLIHAFGHGLSRGYSLQQGAAHGIIAPHALAYLFEKVDGRRSVLSEALGVSAEGQRERAAGIVETVCTIRDRLGLPSRLRDIEDMARDDLPTIADAVAADPFLGNGPPEFTPTVNELETVLREAW